MDNNNTSAKNTLVLHHLKTVLGLLGLPNDDASCYRQNFDIEQYHKTPLFLGDESKKDSEGRIPCKRTNVYFNELGDFLVVRDVHIGTTPFMLCDPMTGRQMRSSAYLCPQDIEPSYEFYRPDKKEGYKLKGEMLNHYKKGGLILRQLKKVSKFVKPKMKL